MKKSKAKRRRITTEVSSICCGDDNATMPRDKQGIGDESEFVLINRNGCEKKKKKSWGQATGN